MATTLNSSTAQSWDFELVSLRDEIMAAEGVSIVEAARMAVNSIGIYEQYAQQWDEDANWALLLAYAPVLVTPEPEPPAPSAAQRKAAFNLARGIQIIAHAGGHLVPSATRNIVHFVRDGACSCEAHGVCWHLEAVAQFTRRAA